MKPNWCGADDYPRVDQMTPSTWAWEFLRRNLDYVADWKTFEARIGEYAGQYQNLSEREMAAFLRDSRYQQARGTGEPIPLAYYFGRKWGLAQIADPDTAYDPRTQWINRAENLMFAGPWFAFDDPRYVVPAIDLALPLDPQIAALRAHCEILQSELGQAGEIDLLLEKRKRFHLYPSLLRVLDGHAAGAGLSELAKVLLPRVANTPASGYLGNQRIRYYLETATEISQGGYRRLLLIPEK